LACSGKLCVIGAARPLVVLDHVSRSFDAGRIVALDDVSFAVDQGALIAVYGPSGSGKSTLINMMAGIDLPSAGTVAFDGKINAAPRQWAELRAQRIGVVFQDFNLLPTLTAAENIEIAMFGRTPGAAARRDRAMERLALVGVADCARRLPQELSGGERRRVSIARGLANDPALLLADEPTSNIDTANGQAVMDLLLHLHRQRGMAMVIVTHDERVIARCPRRVQMRDGRIADQICAGEDAPA
jgi:ABC-type lipoprotein export system ATPase subunit